MRLRRWISLLALVGVLAHAFALVRHNVFMATAQAQAAVARPAVPKGDAPSEVAASLVSELAIICHAAGDASKGGSPQKPGAPGCPLCAGLAPLAALAVADDTLIVSLSQVGLRLAAADVALDVVARIRPHSRGPPRA